MSSTRKKRRKLHPLAKAWEEGYADAWVCVESDGKKGGHNPYVDLPITQEEPRKWEVSMMTYRPDHQYWEKEGEPMLQAKLEAGWEPFAVNNAWMYFKRKRK